MAQIGTWCDMYKSPQAPQIAELRYSGTPTGATFTYSITVLQQTESFLSVSSGTDIDLPAGHYYAVSYPDFTRTIASRNNKVFWFVDGVQVGKEGGSDYYSGQSTDCAQATFTLHEAGVLTLQQVAWSGAAITLTNDAFIYIWRVPR
jgi:hypothetical protein